MSLQKQSLSVSLSQGVDTKTDPKQLSSGKLLTLENGIFITPQELRKRNGYTALPNTVKYPLAHSFSSNRTLTAGRFLTTFNEETIVGDGQNLYSYSPALGTFVVKGTAPVVGQTTTSIIANTYNQTNQDSATNANGLQLVAYQSSGFAAGLYLTALDANTGQTLITSFFVSSGANYACCLALGTGVVCFYYEPATSSISYVTLTASGISAPTLLISDPNTTTAAFDITLFNGVVYIVYAGNATNIKVVALNSSLTITQTYNLGGNSAKCFAVFGMTQFGVDYVLLGFSDGVSVSYLVLLASNLTASGGIVVVTSGLTGVTRITGVGDSQGTGAFFLFWDAVAAADTFGRYSNNTVSYATMFLGVGVTDFGIYFRSANLASKAILRSSPFSSGNPNPYVIVNHDSNLQPTYFLTCLPFDLSRWSGSRAPSCVVMPICRSQAGLMTQTYNRVTSLFESTTPGIFQCALLQVDLLFTTNTTPTVTQNGVVLVTLDFTKPNPQTSSPGSYLLLGTSGLHMYDGVSVTEHGFALYPEGVSVLGFSTGGSIGPGTYGYKVVYEWTDALGNVHQSAPSVVQSTAALTGTTNSVTVTIPTLRLTSKQNVRIVIYRTLANQTLYYRVTLPTSPIINSVASDTVSYFDVTPDSTILAQQQLYTTGGTVENIAPPAVGYLSTFKNRAILFPSDSPGSFWYSKEILPGTPVEFSDIFTVNAGTLGGNLVGGVAMDDKFILLTPKTISYMVGSGPTPAGTQDSFSTPQLITTDCGAVNAASIVLTPMGIMFKSAQGICLLDRALNANYIGAAVEAYNSATILDAQLLQASNQVRFNLSTGVTLVYDYFMNQWAVFTNYSAVAATLINNVYSFVQSNGTVMQESTGFTDNGAAISLKLVTGWMNLAGLQGYQRVYKLLVLGAYVGPHSLVAGLSYDFNPTVVQTDTISVLTAPPNNLYEWRIFCARQKCTSIQLTLQDTQVSGFNEGLSLSALGLEVGTKAGLNKLPSTQSFG
jgi:hypothetical protein